MYLKYAEGAAHARNRRNVADEIVVEILVDRSVPRIDRSEIEQRVTIGGSMRDHSGGDIGRGAGPVAAPARRPEPFRQPLRNQPRQDVGGAGWGKTNQQADWPRRITSRQ